MKNNNRFKLGLVWSVSQSVNQSRQPIPLVNIKLNFTRDSYTLATVVYLVIFKTKETKNYSRSRSNIKLKSIFQLN